MFFFIVIEVSKQDMEEPKVGKKSLFFLSVQSLARGRYTTLDKESIEEGREMKRINEKH